MPNWVVGPNEPDNEAFGNLLENFRTQLGLTRAEAARKCRFSSEYLRLIERGKRVPAWGNMPTIFDAYDVKYNLVGRKYLIDEATIEFTSRIQEARHRNGSHITKSDNRSRQIGKIVEFLVEADDELIEIIHMYLLTKARVENMSSNREAI